MTRPFFSHTFFAFVITALGISGAGALDGARNGSESENAAAARVYLFMRTDCPIGNRFAPEIRRLHEEFSKQGVAFQLVYADATETEAMITKHREGFSLPIESVRDPDYELVERFGATVTPEAVVVDSKGERIYRGRIDNRFVDFGRARAKPTTRDLHDVLAALVDGEPILPRTTKAVGCYIPDR